MITKGQIISIDQVENNAVVHVPLFDTAGSSFDTEIKCTICYEPGNLNNYKVDDVVFVAFENNEINKAVIIGKLYLGKEKQASNYSYCSSLEATEKAVLPTNTTIGGTNLKDLINLGSQVTLLKDNLDVYQKQITPTTTICRSALINLCNYNLKNYGYGTIKDPSSSTNLIITYDGSSTITKLRAENYMLYMTGNKNLPVLESTNPKFIGAFYFSTGQIYYPVWDESTSMLKLIGVITETLDAHIRRIIEEYTSEVTTVDVSGTETTISKNVGAAVTDVSEEETKQHSSLNIEVVDAIRTEE